MKITKVFLFFGMSMRKTCLIYFLPQLASHDFKQERNAQNPIKTPYLQGQEQRILRNIKRFATFLFKKGNYLFLKYFIYIREIKQEIEKKF